MAVYPTLNSSEISLRKAEMDLMSLSMDPSLPVFNNVVMARVAMDLRMGKDT